MDVMVCFCGNHADSFVILALLKQLVSGSDAALHRKQRWHFVWRKDGRKIFFFSFVP